MPESQNPFLAMPGCHKSLSTYNSPWKFSELLIAAKCLITPLPWWQIKTAIWLLTSFQIKGWISLPLLLVAKLDLTSVEADLASRACLEKASSSYFPSVYFIFQVEAFASVVSAGLCIAGVVTNNNNRLWLCPSPGTRGRLVPRVMQKAHGDSHPRNPFAGFPLTPQERNFSSPSILGTAHGPSHACPTDVKCVGRVTALKPTGQGV